VREASTALLLLRCYQLGISFEDRDRMNLGMLYDIFTEHENDSYDYDELPTDEDIANF